MPRKVIYSNRGIAIWRFFFISNLVYKILVGLNRSKYNDTFLAVLCNNPKKYAVVEPEGRIAAQKCIDIVVRHVAVSPSAVQQTDKFRIQIFEDNSPGEVVGKRDVLATLHPGVYPQGKLLCLKITKKTYRRNKELYLHNLWRTIL